MKTIRYKNKSVTVIDSSIFAKHLDNILEVAYNAGASNMHNAFAFNMPGYHNERGSETFRIYYKYQYSKEIMVSVKFVLHYKKESKLMEYEVHPDFYSSLADDYAGIKELKFTNPKEFLGSLHDRIAEDLEIYFKKFHEYEIFKKNRDTAFTIDSAEQLAGLAQIVAGTAVDENGNAIAQDSFSAKTVTLGSEINLAEKEWTPIGNEAYAFDGTFDGGEKTIRNLFVNNESYAGLFGKVGANGTVKNVSVENAVINTSAYGAAVVGYSYGDIDHCSAVDAVISSDDTAGAIVAFTPADSVTAVTNNCAEDVEIVAGCDAGIIAGRAPSGKCTLNGNTWSNVTVEFNGVLGNSGTNIAETEAGRTN